MDAQKTISQKATFLKRTRSKNAELTCEEINQDPTKKTKTDFIDLEIDSPYDSIEEVPTYHLTDKEMSFADPIELLNKLQDQYASYGAIKLVASPHWNPQCCFRAFGKGITTRVQILEQLKQGKPFSQNIEAYTLPAFQRKANHFEQHYLFKSGAVWLSQLNKEENQYWRLVNSDKDVRLQTAVEYAADLPASKQGSGFPRSESPKKQDEFFHYARSLFNLNNLFKSPSSILGFCEERHEHISGITSPWVYIGMLFATFCWHVEDCWLNSLNYNHKGAIKTWYVIPGAYKEQFDSFVQNNFAHHLKNKNILDRITIMVDPLQLIENGIKVYKVNQSPKEYVCTFFKAYHAGFSHGYNIGEAVNFASPQSLAYIQQAIEYYMSKDFQKTSIAPFEWFACENYKRIGKFPQHKKLISNACREAHEIEYERLFQVFTDSDLNVSAFEFFDNSTKYWKYQCNRCKNYCYLNIFICLGCDKKFCDQHLNQCKDKGCIVKGKRKLKLLIRELNRDRENILELSEGMAAEYQTYKGIKSKARKSHTAERPNMSSIKSFHSKQKISMREAKKVK